MPRTSHHTKSVYRVGLASQRIKPGFNWAIYLDELECGAYNCPDQAQEDCDKRNKRQT